MTATKRGQRANTAPTGPAGRRPPGRSRAEMPRPPHACCAEHDARLWRLACSFAALFLEVEAGQRPRAHLEPLMDPELSDRLAPVWVRSGPRGSISSVHGTCRGEVYDAVVLVRRGPRLGALCLRLVQTTAGWRVGEASRPEDALPPAQERSHLAVM